MLLENFWTTEFLPSKTHLRECTLIGYESTWRLHVSKLGNLDMDEITSEILQEWIDSFTQPGAVRKAWALLRSLLRLAYKRRLTTTNTEQLEIHLPAIPRSEAETLSMSQVRRLLHGFYNHPLEAWLICSISLGLRPEEALALTWKDINLRRGLVHITKGAQWLKGREIIVPPKTNLSNRVLPLQPFAKTRLRQLKAKGRLIDGYTLPQVSRAYARWCQQEHLPWVTPESLRHTWATLAIKAKIDISVVSRMLGHASIETTANHYLHADIGIMRSAQKTWQRKMLEE